MTEPRCIIVHHLQGGGTMHEDGHLEMEYEDRYSYDEYEDAYDPGYEDEDDEDEDDEEEEP